MKKFLSLVVLIALMGSSTKTTAAPTLNSYSESTADIYLDFDGHDVNSSLWNYGTPFICSPTTMTDEQITDAFNRVEEDFRPFNINVTTDLSKFLAAPLDQRVRVVLTPSSSRYSSVAGPVKTVVNRKPEELPVINVDDLKDPRLKAYQDSLRLYNSTSKIKDTINTYRTTNQNNPEYVKLMKADDDNGAFIITPISTELSDTTWGSNKNVTVYKVDYKGGSRYFPSSAEGQAFMRNLNNNYQNNLIPNPGNVTGYYTSCRQQGLIDYGRLITLAW